MPRDIGTGAYHYPEGTPGNTGQTIFSTRYNTFLDDLANSMNQVLPVNMGGTGSDTANEARDALDAELAGVQVTDYNQHVFECGSFWSNGSAVGRPSGLDVGLAGVCVLIDGIQSQMVLVAVEHLTGKQWFRSKSANVWGSWVSSEVSNDTRNDARYVNVTGDTMTGHLALPTGPAAEHAVRKDYVDAGDATNAANINNRVLRTGDSMTGMLNILHPANGGGLYVRSNNAGMYKHIGVGRTSNDELLLGVSAASNNYLAGTSAGDGAVSALQRLYIGNHGATHFILSNGGIGRASSFQTQYNFVGNVNGLSMKGPDTSSTKAFIDFADSTMTHCGSINVNQTAHSTAYATSSDERGKPNREKIAPEAARKVIDALEIYDFDKDGNTIRGYGVVAQQAYTAHKSLAFPPQNEADTWSIEKAAPVPFLIAALQGANQHIDKLEERLKALELKFAGGKPVQ